MYFSAISKTFFLLVGLYRGWQNSVFLLFFFCVYKPACFIIFFNVNFGNSIGVFRIDVNPLSQPSGRGILYFIII